MENQAKPASNGAEPATTSTQMLGAVLRCFAIALLIVATIIMGAAKQTKTIITGEDPDTGELLVDSVTAKPTYSSAYIYFIVVNAIACFYSILSLAVAMGNQLNTDGSQLLLSMADVAIMALLFSSAGAAIQFGILSEKGNSHTGWDKFCDVLGKFCAKVTAAIVLSMIASLAYLVLVMLAMIRMNKKRNN